MPEQAEIVYASETVMPGMFGNIRLVVTDESVDLSRLTAPSGLPFLNHHDGDRPLGMVTRSQILNGVAYASVQLKSTTRSTPYIEEIRAGIRKGVSPGFLIFESEIQETDDGEYEIVVSKWRPYELSGTPIPRNSDAAVLSLSGSPKEKKAAVPAQERPSVERPAARPVETVEASVERIARPAKTSPTEEERMTTLKQQEKIVDKKLAALSKASANGKRDESEPLPLHEQISELVTLAQNPSGVTPKGVEIESLLPRHVAARIPRSPSMTAALVASTVYGSEITTVERGDIQPSGRNAERLLSLCRQVSIPFGSTSFPVMSSSPSAGMVADGAAPISITDATFTDPAPSASYHPGQVRAAFSLQAALQGGDVFRQMVDDSLQTALAELQALQLVGGDGVSPNVRGLLNVSGIGTSDYVSTARGSAGSFRAAEDVLDDAEYGPETRRVWLLSGDLYRTSRRTLREPGNSDYVLSNGRVLDEIPAIKTAGLDDNSALLIDAAFCAFCQWDRSDIILDMVTAPGTVKVTLTVGIDVVPIRENAIVKMDQG